MGLFSKAVGFVAGGPLGALTAQGLDDASRARKQARGANKLLERAEMLQQRRDIIDRLRETRIAAATTQAVAANTGTEASSGAQGAQGALFTDFGANIDLASQVSILRRRAGAKARKADSLSSRSALSLDIVKTGINLFAGGIG